MREVKIAVHDERRRRQTRTDRIRRVDAHHQIRRVVGAPRPRVREVVFRVQGVVANQAGEDAALNRQSAADRREIRHVGRTEMAQRVRPAEIRRDGRESIQLHVLARLDRRFESDARVFGHVLADVRGRHVDVELVDVARRPAIPEFVVRRIVRIQQRGDVDQRAELPRRIDRRLRAGRIGQQQGEDDRRGGAHHRARSRAIACGASRCNSSSNVASAAVTMSR